MCMMLTCRALDVAYELVLVLLRVLLGLSISLVKLNRVLSIVRMVPKSTMALRSQLVGSCLVM